MFDFLDKIGLKAVLEEIKGKIPTSLPANGGNADKIKVKTNTVRTETYGLSCYHYETSASYTENYEIPTPYVDVLRLMFDSNRGIEIAVNWNTSSTVRRLWVRGNHTGWSKWELINFPYETGNVSASYSTVAQDFAILDFTPKVVICKYASKYDNEGTMKWATPITNGFRVTINSTEATSLSYIAFR